MAGIDRRFDALVIGSGVAGSIAVKELTERGLDVLLLEAGRDLTDADFEPPPPKAHLNSYGRVLQRMSDVDFKAARTRSLASSSGAASPAA
jgi:choline dehydrogenase-like flavoprotein